MFEKKKTIMFGSSNCPISNQSTLSVTQSWLTLVDTMDCSPPGSSVQGIFLSKNTGVGCHFLLQGTFLTQGSNPLMSPVLTGRFFTTSTTWETPLVKNSGSQTSVGFRITWGASPQHF